MATKFLVQAVARPGYAGFNRAGRHWSSGEATEVELVEDEKDEQGKVKDPEQEVGKPYRINRTQYQALDDEPNIILRQPGDPVANQAKESELRAENERLRAQLAALTAQPGQDSEGGGEGGEGGPRRRRAG